VLTLSLERVERLARGGEPREISSRICKLVRPSWISRAIAALWS
jgi:hypothetical protein